MSNVIEIQSLRHAYGREEVLRGLDLVVEQGSIYGFLGRNGVGKSTCIRILAGLLGRTSGDVRVLGADPTSWGRTTLERFGYAAEGAFLPGQVRVDGLIAWTKSLYPRWSDAVANRLLQRFRIDVRKRLYQLSLGQQRQVSFVLAAAPRPELMILDEPAANLDTVARRGFLEEIAGLAREEGTTVFFSTHVLGDVERVADRVGILADGRLLVDEPLDELKESVRQVRFSWERDDAPPIDPPGAYRVRRGRGETLVTMRIRDERQVADLAAAAGCGWEIRGLNLEDLFVELTEGEIK
jgi:ABC-2 type transport system ATP-binding protein